MKDPNSGLDPPGWFSGWISEAPTEEEQIDAVEGEASNEGKCSLTQETVGEPNDKADDVSSYVSSRAEDSEELANKESSEETAWLPGWMG